jgi:hypothetical protein
MRQYTQSVEGGIAWLDDRGAPNAVPKVPGTTLKLEKTSDGDVARYYFATDAPKLYGQDPKQFPIRVGDLAGEYYPNVFLYTGTYTTPIALRVGILSLDPAIVKAQYLELAARRKPADKASLTLALPWQLENANSNVNVHPIYTLYGSAGFGFTFPERTKVIAPFFPDLASREVAFFYAPDRTSMGTAVMIHASERRYVDITIGFQAQVYYDTSGPLEIQYGQQQRTNAGVLLDAGATSFKDGNVVKEEGNTMVRRRSEPFELMKILGSLVAVRARK